MTLSDGDAASNGLPASLYARTLHQFDSLHAADRLLYIPHTTTKRPSKTFPTAYQLAPHLAYKPVLPADAPERRSNAGAKSNPFADPDPAFTIPFNSETHTLMLNKFPVYRPALLLVTKEYRPQYSALDANDVRASWDLLSELKSDSSRTSESTAPQWLAFYNCGAEAGSSQGHKHVQVMPLPDSTEIGFEPFPSAASSITEIAESIYSVPFAHFALKLPSGCGFEEVVNAHVRLLTRMREFVTHKGWKMREAGCEAPHNVLLTRGWICIVPRRHSGAERWAMANALGMLGVIWITDDSQIADFTDRKGGVDGHMQFLGWPR